MKLFPLLLMTVLSVGALAVVAAGEAPPTSVRPNVVIILADDMAWGDLSLHGNPNLATPQLDALARSGASFGHFYVCQVCAPTRAEFLTGRYHPRTGASGVLRGEERLNLDERTLADIFRAAGYRTGAFGKWHNGSQWPYHPNARGFEEFYGFAAGHWPEYFDPLLEHNGEMMRARGHITDILTERALGFMEQHRAEPFLCYLPFNTPHTPLAVPAADWARFRKKPVTARARPDQVEDLEVTRACLAMVEGIDRNVGRVLQKLTDLGLAENTIVVFFSDNGPATYRWNGDMKGRKTTLDEGGLRAPLFIRWPGKIAPGLVVRPIAGAIDLLPTLAALTGTPVTGTKPLDGEDLSPLLLGGSAPWPERLLFSQRNGRVSVRSSGYRLDGDGALFDLIADPGQRHDVAGERPKIAEQLAAAARRWKAEAVPTERMDRPFTVGYREFPLTRLPVGEATLAGGVKYSAVIVNSCYLTDWKKPADTITWDVEVHTAGAYEVTLHYTCPEGKTGSAVELGFLDAKIAGQIGPAWDPPLYKNQDTVPRQDIISAMKEFRRLVLGTVRLPAGRGPLTLRALNVPHGYVADLLEIELRLKP